MQIQDQVILNWKSQQSIRVQIQTVFLFPKMDILAIKGHENCAGKHKL